MSCWSQAPIGPSPTPKVKRLWMSRAQRDISRSSTAFCASRNEKSAARDWRLGDEFFPSNCFDVYNPSHVQMSQDHLGVAPHQFLPTRWSLIVRAGDPSKPSSRDALAELYKIYWYPLYAYVRRRNVDAHAAADLIQSFFAELLGGSLLRRAD